MGTSIDRASVIAPQAARRLLCVCLLVGCSSDAADDAAASSTVTASDGEGASSLPTASDPTASPSTSDGGSTDDPGTATTADPTDDSATDGSASSSDGADGTTGPPPIQFCGLEDLKHGAPNPIVSGSEPMQIPPDIATILVDNCGCHYADMLDVGPPVADYSSTLPLHIETWEQWQGSYGFPMNLKPTLPAVLDRVQDSPLQFTMPHRSCNVGDGEQMVPAQREVLIDWMLAGAPDGATWIP